MWGDRCVNYFDLGKLSTAYIPNNHVVYFKYIQFYLSLAPQNIWGKFFKKLSSVSLQAEWRNFTGPKTETQFGSIQQGFFEHLLCAKYSPRCLENSNEQQKLYSWLRCCIERKQVTRKTCVPAVAAGEKKKGKITKILFKGQWETVEWWA